MKGFSFLVVAVASAAGPGCGSLASLAEHPSLQGAAGALASGGVRAGAAALPIGLDEELSYGGAIAIQIVQRYGGLYEDPKAVEYVVSVGDAVAIHSTRPELAYHFAILDTDDVNALSAPGGYIFVTRGALAKMKDEAELAGVLGHEIGHVCAKHALDIIRKMKAAEQMASAAADAWKEAAVFSGIVDKYVLEYLEQGLPKDTEFEADRIGAEMLARIGWRPAGLRDFLARMAADEAKAPHSAFVKTHPKTADRVAALDKALVGVDARGQANAERFQAALPVPLPKNPGPAAAPAQTPTPAPAAAPASDRPTAPARPEPTPTPARPK